MTPRLSISLRRVDQLNTTVITVPAGNYSSTNVGWLGLLGSALTEVAASTDCLSVILDLSAIEIGGSSFLTCLDSFEKKLSSNGRRLIVCGDRTGLIDAVNWSDRMQYQRDLVDALNSCAVEPVYDLLQFFRTV